MEPTGEPEPLNPLRALGAFLAGSEIGGITTHLAGEATLNQALVAMPTPRRPRACELLSAARLGPRTRKHSVAILCAVAGAASRIRDVTPAWTVPARTVGSGALTADVSALVDGTNTSVVCVTYNLQPASAPWIALVDLRTRHPGVSVRLHLDTWTADRPFRRPEGRRGYREQNHDQGNSSRLSTDEVAQQLRGTIVVRTRAPKDGRHAMTSRAKFLSIGHRFLLVGSANLSYSTEERNVEFGLRLGGPALTRDVEEQMRGLEETVYEPVR